MPTEDAVVVARAMVGSVILRDDVAQPGCSARQMLDDSSLKRLHGGTDLLTENQLDVLW
jgi:hypothetical protein